MKKIEIFNDVCVIKPDIFSDERGSFQESYNYKALSELGFNEEFIQDNISHSASAEHPENSNQLHPLPYYSDKFLPDGSP